MKESILAGNRIGVYIPDHPAANNRGYVLRYRYIMEQFLGRLLRPSEEVHHKNGDEKDDRIENLELVSKVDHAKIHGESRRKLNYELVKRFREEGLGYKKIANLTGYARSSIQSACKVMNV